jgi:5'-nucleotidase
MPAIKLLHTNDFHNHLSAEQAARLAALRGEIGAKGLLLDAGDAVSSGNVTFKSGGEPILETMSSIGYDAMAVGNREFHFSRKGFFAKLSLARFPILCANVRSTPADGPNPLPVLPWIPFTIDSVRIVVFGLTVPMITERMLVRKVSAFVFDDPIETARGLVQDLRGQCDIVVCLSHIGLAKDRELARNVPDIDLIVGGHTHAVLPQGEWVGDTLIVQAGWRGHYVGIVDVELGKGKRELTAKLAPL